MKCGIKLDIHFENGMILRANALNRQIEETSSLRNFMFSSFPNGIVAGFSLVKDENGNFKFTDGIAKINNCLFVLNEVAVESLNEITCLDGSHLEFDHFYYLCLVRDVFVENQNSTNQTAIQEELSPIQEEQLLLMALTKDDINKTDAIIVGKFQKTVGGIRIAETLEDCSTSKFSTSCGDYSIAGDKAFSSIVTKMICERIQEKKNKDFYDISLYMLCVQNFMLGHKALEFYCSNKLDKNTQPDNIITDFLKAVEIDKNPIRQEIQSNKSNDNLPPRLFDPNL